MSPRAGELRDGRGVVLLVFVPSGNILEHDQGCPFLL